MTYLAQFTFKTHLLLDLLWVYVTKVYVIEVYIKS